MRAVERRTTDNGVLRPDVYWMAHGASLVRVAHHFARREVPTERLARLNQFPETAARGPTFQRVRRALHPVRGPGEVPSDQEEQAPEEPVAPPPHNISSPVQPAESTFKHQSESPPQQPVETPQNNETEETTQNNGEGVVAIDKKKDKSLPEAREDAKMG